MGFFCSVGLNIGIEIYKFFWNKLYLSLVIWYKMVDSEESSLFFLFDI